MTATEQKWDERVSSWLESGLTSEKFCEGRDFNANWLRHWAYRLGKAKPRRRRRKVRLARVVRALAAAPVQKSSELVGAALAVELGGVRVMVRPGFDPITLAALLDVLAARGGAR